MHCRALDGRRSFPEELLDLLTQLRRIGMMMDHNCMLHRCVQQFLIGIGGQSYRTVHVTWELATINEFACHDFTLLSINPRMGPIFHTRERVLA